VQIYDFFVDSNNYRIFAVQILGLTGFDSG